VPQNLSQAVAHDHLLGDVFVVLMTVVENR